LNTALCAEVHRALKMHHTEIEISQQFAS